MRSGVVGLLITACVAALVASNAAAGALQFTYTVFGAPTTPAGGPTWTWTSPSSPIVVDPNPVRFYLPVVVESNGNVGNWILEFWDDGSGGGFTAAGGGPVNFYSSQLFTLDAEFRPTFLTGTFIGYDGLNDDGPASLTISDVPESGTLALLGLGLAGLGLSRRRKAD